MTAETNSMMVFDRALVRQHRDRAASQFTDFDFLFAEVAERLADRLLDIKRVFPLALDLGCHGGELGRLIRGRRGVETVVGCDLSPAFARKAGTPAVAADEEFLPFAEGSIDLVVSNLSLHWVNDLPGALVQARRVMRPDGFFLAALLGGDTLIELRRCLVEAEATVTGGASPRVSPFADVRDLGALLQRAGFALPVVDSDTLTVTYDNVFKLMADLRGMGETNAVAARRRVPARRDMLAEAARLYAERYAEPDGRIPATFQVLYAAGWAPHESQQKPLKPGTAQTPLAEALGVGKE
ncbi:MAG TPA: methyltransferase domain-containing protein [Azospirillaceae bacterium]|nr:methyltransferase domain-containing protein [Azospirillaceae bacterium]